jgi:hypothetical protein
MFYPTSKKSFDWLVSNPQTFDAISQCSQPTKMDLIFNPDGPAKFGGFKKATFGHTSQVLLGDSPNVCIKQSWYSCQASGLRLPYDNHTQVVKLSLEITCLQWASALMDLVYDFIAQHCATEGNPPFEIPQVSFVNTALAVTENSSADTYLIEEVIEEVEGGEFVKYIGNSSARPCRLPKKSQQHRAQFFTFCQHVQFWKTKRLVFIGDFQGMSQLFSMKHHQLIISNCTGGLTLLTDPQIITST